ncbi:MAG: type VI secretion system tip protein VgrG [Reinekea sp.]
MSQSLANINRVARQFGMADESKYFIQVDQYDFDAFFVESVKINEWTLTEANYRLEVKVLTNHNVDTTSLLNKKVVFSFLWRGSMAPITAEIEQVIEGFGNDDHNGYRLFLRSPLAALRESNHNRVFMDKSSLDIAKDILTEFSAGRFAVFVKAQAPAVRRMTVQYQEKDWDFLYRILLQDGIMVHVHQDNNAIEVYLIDDVSQLPFEDAPIELAYRTSRGVAADEESVSQVFSMRESTPHLVQVADYQANEDQKLFAEAESDQDGTNVDHRWGLNVSDSESADQLAERLAVSYKAKQESLLIESNCRGLRPGMVINLTSHPHWSGEYIIIRCECKGSQSEAMNSGVSSGAKAFESSVLAVPSGKPYLPVLPKRNLVTNTFTSVVSEEVNHAGYYQVRLPFDMTSSQGQTSIPTRMMQAFGGEDHGMHFPLVKGTQVNIGFENGDPDRPVILGALHNDQTPSVVTSENSYQNLIRTRGQSELLLDDTPKEELIRLNTAEEKNRLQLNATADSNFVELHSEEGDLNLNAGKNIQIESGSDMNVSVGGNQEITVAGDYKLMTEKGDISHQSGTDIQLTATQNIDWITEKGDIILQVGAQWSVEAAEGVRTHVVNGNHQVVVDNGAYSMEVSADVGFSAGDAVTLTQGSGAIAIDSSGNISLEGGNVDITGDKIAIKGSKVGNN